MHGFAFNCHEWCRVESDDLNFPETVIITCSTKSVLTVGPEFLSLSPFFGSDQLEDCTKPASSCDFFIANRISFYQMSRDQHAYKHAGCIAKVACYTARIRIPVRLAAAEA